MVVSRWSSGESSVRGRAARTGGPQVPAAERGGHDHGDQYDGRGGAQSQRREGEAACDDGRQGHHHAVAVAGHDRAGRARPDAGPWRPTARRWTPATLSPGVARESHADRRGQHARVIAGARSTPRDTGPHGPPFLSVSPVAVRARRRVRTVVPDAGRPDSRLARCDSHGRHPRFGAFTPRSGCPCSRTRPSPTRPLVVGSLWMRTSTGGLIGTVGFGSRRYGARASTGVGRRPGERLHAAPPGLAASCQ